ncbi:MAG TPA: hydroxysqualene dehydroxylase HpnE, partial [Azospira sp.]|nr:hydroxysqualene dehydroxylase HpnE [Azospira sp.]
QGVSPAPCVAVVGAGWAGLACAVELAQQGIAVSVFESARQPGGRARKVEVEGLDLDNGPHLLIGAYSATRDLMARIGSQRHLRQAPLALLTPPHFSLRLPRLPAPLHLAWGLLTAKGVGLGEKIAAARFMEALKATGFRLPADGTVSELLRRHRQGPGLTRFLWEPLCLAALNTPAATASAQVFANVLRDSLGGPGGATDMLLPTTHLGSLVPEPAAAWLAAKGQPVRLSSRVRRLSAIDGRWQVEWEEGAQSTSQLFDQVVIATGPQHSAALLPQTPLLDDLRRQLAAFVYEPIATVYLQYPEDLALPFPLLGLAGPVGQWVFDRGPLDGHRGLLACVLSAHGPWEDLAPEALAQALQGELEAALGRPLPPPRWQRTIREARATFACLPNLERPANATPLPGLWLAGDYTAGDYPATLEGAVRSGLQTARSLLG